MTQTVTIGIYGETDSGKTTLAVQIITYFKKQGLKIATIKQTDKTILLDNVGKDTYKHKQAGALCSVLSSAKNTDIMIDKKIKTSELLEALEKIEMFDLIIIEGATDPSIPKIRIGDIQQRSNTILDYKGDFNQVIDVIHQKLKKKNTEKTILIKVNAKQVPLSEFPAEIIQNTITGMLSSLKGIQSIDTVEIKIKK